MGHSKLGPKEDEGVINLIQATDGADLCLIGRNFLRNGVELMADYFLK